MRPIFLFAVIKSCCSFETRLWLEIISSCEALRLEGVKGRLPKPLSFSEKSIFRGEGHERSESRLPYETKLSLPTDDISPRDIECLVELRPSGVLDLE